MIENDINIISKTEICSAKKKRWVGGWYAGNNSPCKYQKVEAERPGRQAAVDLHEMKVCSRVMAAWVEFSKEEKRRQYGHVMKAIVFQRRQDLQ